MARLRLLPALAVLALLVAACDGEGGEEPVDRRPAQPTDTPPVSTETEPSAAATPRVPGVPPSSEISLPPGFAAYPVAEGLSSPTSVTLDAEGQIYVSQLGGPVFRLEDADGDGVFEGKTEHVTGVEAVDGIAFSPQGELYVSWRSARGGDTGTVTIARDTDGDGTAEAKQDVITGLPNGSHQNNGMAFGPDGKLYVTNGSTCNDCQEADERSATILQANPDGSGLRVYARGLRNAYDIVFDDRGRLWSSDNGSDPTAPRCNTIDELNLIVDGGDYGWPYQPGCDSFQDGTPPVADLGFNTGSTGLAVHDGEHFPTEYRGNFFVTLWGDLGYTDERAGRVLVRVSIDESSGSPRGTVDEFGTGFGNPIDVILDRDGTLLVLDFSAGRLYRIIHTG